MKLATITVEITRSEKTRNLCARVVQQEAKGAVRGCNLLLGRRIRKINTAQNRVLAELTKAADEIVWRLLAAPDLEPPYKHVTRRQLREEISS